MDLSQPLPEPFTATTVVPPPPTTEPTTHHSQTAVFRAAINGEAVRSTKRGRGRPRKKQAQPAEPKPVVLGLSEALLAEMDTRRGKISQSRPFTKQNVANRTPLPQVIPAVKDYDSSKKRNESLPKDTVVQPAAIGGRPGKSPEKRWGRPAHGGPKEMKKNVSQQVVDVDSAPQSTMVNLQKNIEIMRSRIKQVIGVLKPHIFAAENPSNSAMAAILELEQIATDSKQAPLFDLNVHPDSLMLKGWHT